MSREWHVIEDGWIYRGTELMAIAGDTVTAGFICAAIKHYIEFLGETSSVDADIEPEHMFFIEKTQKGSDHA